MSSDWCPVTLQEVTSVLGDGLHGTPEYDDAGDYYFINGNNLVEGAVVFTEKTRRVSEDEYSKYRKNLNDRTILVSINGTLGNVALYRGENVVLGKSACYFNVREDVDKGFVRYVVSGPAFQDYIHTLATGSTIKNVSLKLMRDFKFELPPITEQRRVASILGALDDRIALLRETNTTLEAIAQALFKSWFVDFDPVRAKQQGRAPEGMDEATAELFPDEFEESELGLVPRGWRNGVLLDLADLNPESWTVRKHPETITYIDLANAKDNEIVALTEYPFAEAPSRARRVLRDGDTIIGTVRPGNRSFAFICHAPDHLTGSTGFAVLRPTNVSNTEYVHLAATQDVSIEHLAHVADGGAYPAVRPEVVAALPCVLPSESVMAVFHGVVAPLLSKVVENQHQAQTLATLRDTLLPRLISGQLQLSDLDVSEIHAPTTPEGMNPTMIKRSISELHFVKGRDPKPTVEVQAESLEEQGLYVGDVVESALSRFAAKNPKVIATIYTYGTISVNFHEQGWSEFLIVAGEEKVLKELGRAFSSLAGGKSRYSDYISPSEGSCAFHIEDGLLWEPEDAVTWYAVLPENMPAKLVVSAVDEDEESKNDDDGWGDVIQETETEAGQDEDLNEPAATGRVPEQAARYRVARSDARVASIRQTIERIFGLPEGSVALCGPDGRALRGDAFIRTLRRRWEEA